LPFDDVPDHGVIEIPYQRLSADALDGVLAEFVGREGTDYGDYDVSWEQKKQQVLVQLQQGKAVLLFDPDAGSCHIEMAEVVRQHGRQPN
jgi:uncharacterized protein YheU (UPF0270 family)